MVSPSGTIATLSLDTRHLANGPFAVRIAAFDRPAEIAGATETTAMAPRTWAIRNGVTPGSRTNVDSRDSGCRFSVQDFETAYPSFVESGEKTLSEMDVAWRWTYHWAERGATVTFTWNKALGSTMCTSVFTQGEPQTGFAPLFPEVL